MTDYLTLVGTALNKQPRQLLGIGRRIIKSNTLPRLPVDIDARYENKIPDNFEPVVEPLRENTEALQASTVERREQYRAYAQAAAAGQLTFLNETVTFNDGESIAMDAPQIREQSLHWQLKCWGFEHLKNIWLGYSNPKEVSEEEIAVHRAWITEWRRNYPIAGSTAYLRQYWMPHSVCLRILNWARYDAFLAEQLDREFRRQIRELVYKNGAFLSDNIEHGVGGNHLIENAVALVVAGGYCNVEAWKNQGQQILTRAADEQFFTDGGHFERSPMYHLIVWQRYLTCYDLFGSVGRSTEKIQGCARKTREFAENICTPDGRIPLLNDSVFGEALRLPECLAYSSAVGIGSQTGGVSEYNSMPETGYYWLGEEGFRVLVAANEIAVPHIPAHAHAQPGHICLWVDGKRVLTDTGVYEYAAGKKRDKSRSVESHNTVQVGDVEPVRMGSSFWLWGQLNPVIEYDEKRVRMNYSSAQIESEAYQHKREIVANTNQISVKDTTDCNSEKIYSRFHIHPRYEASIEDTRVLFRSKNGKTVLCLRYSDNLRVTIENSEYYPEFGNKKQRDMVQVEHRSQKDTKLVLVKK